MTTVHLPLVIGTRHYIDLQTMRLSCEKFKTDEICKICKKENKKHCFKGGKQFELIPEPDLSEPENYQQEISMYPPNGDFCYFNITYTPTRDSEQQLQDQLYISKNCTKNCTKSCSELGNWSVTKPCHWHDDCRPRKKQDYFINYLKGIKYTTYYQD